MVSVHENPPHRYTVLPEASRRTLVSAGHETSPAGPPKPRLLDRIRAALRTRHYSPRTRLILVENGKVPEQGKGIYLQHNHPPHRSDITTIKMPATAAAYAATLYETLHQADANNYDWIAVDPPPTISEWEAIHDRLRRASS